MAKYKCPTLGDCDKANAGEVFERSPGEDLACPGCATRLEPQITAAPRTSGGKKLLPVAAAVALLALLVGGAYIYTKPQPSAALAVAEPAPATAPAAATAVPAAASAATGIAPSDEETRTLRQQGEAQLTGGDPERAANASSRAAVNELLKLAIANMAQGKLEEAGKDLALARERGPKEPLVYYNTAILRLKQGRSEDAFNEFEASFMAGFSHFDKLAQDHDLDELRKTPRFAALVKRYDTTVR